MYKTFRFTYRNDMLIELNCIFARLEALQLSSRPPPMTEQSTKPEWKWFNSLEETRNIFFLKQFWENFHKLVMKTKMGRFWLFCWTIFGLMSSCRSTFSLSKQNNCGSARHTTTMLVFLDRLCSSVALGAVSVTPVSIERDHVISLLSARGPRGLCKLLLSTTVWITECKSLKPRASSFWLNLH